MKCSILSKCEAINSVLEQNEWMEKKQREICATKRVVNKILHLMMVQLGPFDMDHYYPVVWCVCYQNNDFHREHFNYANGVYTTICAILLASTKKRRQAIVQPNIIARCAMKKCSCVCGSCVLFCCIYKIRDWFFRSHWCNIAYWWNRFSCGDWVMHFLFHCIYA